RLPGGRAGDRPAGDLSGHRAQIQRRLHRLRRSDGDGAKHRFADAAQAHPQRPDPADARPWLRQGLCLRPRDRGGFLGPELFSGERRARRVLPAGRARLRARDQEAPRLLEQITRARPGGRGMTDTITVAAADGTLRLDRWFRRHYPQLAHGRLEKLLRTGQVRVDGKKAKAGDRVEPGQAIRVPPIGEAPAPTAPRQPRPRDEAALRDAVIYRDDWAIVIDKPPGLAVQGGTNTERHVDQLLDGLRFDRDERPRLVHRLDKDTSGVLLIARTPTAAAHFTRA